MNKHLPLIVSLMLALTACTQESGPPAGEAEPSASAGTQAEKATEPGEEAVSKEQTGIVAETISAIKLDTTEGASLARRKCASCHYLDRNLRKVGPTLKGVFGRKPSITGIPFETWDEVALDAWLADPKKVKPKTQMAIPGLKDADERAAIIAYLKQL